VDDTIFATIVEFCNHYVWSFPEALPWMVVILLGVGLFTTVQLRFIQLRRLGHALKAVAGRYDNPEDDGDVSHFQALSTALSATVGIGNIAGVAIAIHWGGPGALFWMWVTAVFGMALKYAECTLSLRYRNFDSQGNVSGGPMYYIQKGLGRRWKPMAIFFAVCAVVASFGGGNMNQANTVAMSAYDSFSIPAWLVGLVSAGLVGMVILGGIKRIAKVTSKLAPFMAVVYLAGALAVIVINYQQLPAAFSAIFRGAFNPQASLGGSVAGIFSLTLLWGIKRGLFSNESGQGSAPIAHAAARTKEPVREGAVALLGPLIDTLIICTMTGLVILTTGVWDEKRQSDIGMNEVSVYAASSVPAKAEHEAARIAAAKDAIESAQKAIEQAEQVRRNGGQLSEAQKSDLQAAEALLAPRVIHVVQGRIPELVFVAREGLVEQPQLLRVHEGEQIPYAGALRFTPGGAKLEPLDKKEGQGEEIELKLAGRMLFTSSALTAWAFERGLSPLGNWGSYVVTFAVFLFALSTMISWSYYGDRAIEYLGGAKYVTIYRIVYVLFVYIGSVSALRIVWDYGDLAIGLMAVPNLIAVALLSPEVVRMTKDYFRRMAKSNTEPPGRT